MAAQNNNWKNTQASSSATLKSTTGNGGATSGRKTEHKKAMRETVAKAAESKKNVGFDFKTAQAAQAKHEKSFRDFTDRKLSGKERVAAFVETLNPNKDWNIWKPIEPKTDADGYVSPGEAFKATDANWQRVNRKAQGLFAKMSQCNPDHTLLAIHYDTEEDFRAAYAAKKSEYEQLKKEYDSITPLVNYWARERAELSDKQRTPDYYEKYAGADANKQTYVDGVHQKLYQDSTELVQGVPFLVNSNGYANIVETVFNKGKELLEDKALENFSDRIGRVLMMTEDERQTYNYYYSRGDYDAAEKYLKVLETRLNDAWGAFKASAYMNNPEHSDFKKATHAIVTNAKAGVRDFNVSVKQAAKTVALGNILPEQRRVYESEAEALAGYSHPAVGFLSNTARSIGNMVPSIMANTIVPGSGIFAQTVSAGAQNYRSERLKGTSHEKASIYGAGTAMITLLTEGMFNGISSLGSGAITRVLGEQADDVLTKVITKVASSPKAQARIKTILELAGNSSSEMLEEIFEAEADTLFRNVLFDENGNLNPFSAEKLEQGLQGALASFALNLLGVSGKHRANVKEFKNIAQQRAIDAAVDVAMGKSGEKKNIVGYTPEESNKITRTAKTYNNYVDGKNMTLKEFFLNHSRSIVKKFEKLYLGKVSDGFAAQANALLKKHGVDTDVTGKHFIVTNDMFDHIEDRHGISSKETAEKVTVDNVGYIKDVINQPDNIRFDGYNEQGKPILTLLKKINGTTAVYVQFVSDERNGLIGKTFFFTSKMKKGTTSAGNTQKSPALYVQNDGGQVPSGEIVPQSTPTVNTESSPKSDIEAIADDLPMRHIDGSVRSYKEYAAEQEAKKQDTPPPADTEAPTANPDVAAAVNAPGVKRAEDIELQYTQRLKGKNAMLFKDLPRVLDYVCDKMPGVRDFWRNRVEKPFWAAKASFARRTEAALRDLKTLSDELGIYVGSKESAAAQWYGEGYRTVQKKNPMYERGNGEPKQVAEREKYTLADLKRDFPDTWENIVAFDKKARSIYEQYIVELNTMLEKIYPDAEVRLQIEISDLRRDIEALRNKPDELFAEREALERDIADLEASIADLKQRRDSGSDIAGALGALEQRREQKQTEFDALKNKGTKKAAHIEKQAAKASDRADALRQSERERLDKAIQKAEGRLASKQAQLDALRIETSERALEINAENIRTKEADLAEKIHALETGEALIGKRVQYRKDYYHHFQETATGFRGLANILFDSDEIDPRLVGASDNTKPKSKWADFMQRQGIGNYDADAVGGLLKYIQAAEYKLAFDPIVSDMRSVIKTIAEDTSETRNANGFILYLTRWTDTLAGKTSFLDRPLQEITQRKVTKAINWLNSRAKGNTILGSFRNFFAQFMNLPNGFLYVQDMKAWGKGIKNAISTLNKNSQAKATIEQSAFLTERYINDVVDSFKRVPLKQFAGSFKKGAIAMMNFGDKFASNIIWNAAYAQGQNQGLTGDELMMYADDITRRAVAGRGVGEMAPALESKWLNLMAPFQVEVNNTWNSLMQVIRGKGGEKVEHRLRAIMMFEGAAWGLNAATQALGIGSMLPSVFEMLGEVLQTWFGDDEEEEEAGIEEKIGKTAALALNEFVSYMPFASSLLPVLFDVETIETFLGSDNEVTRYGSGNLGLSGIASAVAKAAQGDVSGGLIDFASGYALPWGGNQARKIYEGVKDFGGFNDAGVSASYTADGRLRFPMERTPGNVAKGLLFGKYATKEGKAYIDEGGKPLSEKRTTEFNNNVHGGMDPAEAYKTVNTLTDEKITNDVTRQKAYALMDCGFSVENAAKHIKTINKIESDKDGTGNTIDGSKRKKQIRYIYQLNIPDKQKGALYRECIIGADDKKLLLLQAYGISDAQLAQAYPLLAVTEGTKGANGKTVSGSKNKNISAVLSHIQGLTNVQKDALKVMFMTGKTQEYYEKAMVDALLHSSRLNTAQKKDFYSYYYNNDQRVDVDELRKAVMRK